MQAIRRCLADLQRNSRTDPGARQRFSLYIPNAVQVLNTLRTQHWGLSRASFVLSGSQELAAVMLFSRYMAAWDAMQRRSRLSAPNYPFMVGHVLRALGLTPPAALWAPKPMVNLGKELAIRRYWNVLLDSGRVDFGGIAEIRDGQSRVAAALTRAQQEEAPPRYVPPRASVPAAGAAVGRSDGGDDYGSDSETG